jgi:ATP-binding cassette subfamily C protein
VSTGEKQRIALARVFFRDSEMLLLDEPTSSLDVLNEAQILKSLRDHCGDKTVVLVSHRKSTSSICEKIIEFDKET